MCAAVRPHGARPRAALFWGTGLLATATLAYEVALMRLLAVAQFHHLAFMVISLAMLGFGASGTVLAVWPRLGLWRPRATMAWLALAAGVLMPASFALTNWIPFDAYTIWDPRQMAILALHYGVLALPFFACGASLSLLFRRHPRAIAPSYSANMIGSAAGCLLALAAPALVGGEGVLLLCAVGAALAAACYAPRGMGVGRWQRLAALLLTAGSLLGLWRLPAALQVHLSPYKGLSYALQAPDSQVIASHWNAMGRLDLVSSPSLHALPGLSYRAMVAPPAQRGLYRDGDDLSPVLLEDPAAVDAGSPSLAFAEAMPTAGAYALVPGRRVLVLDPLGGLELWVALSQGAGAVDAVVANPLVPQMAGGIYGHPRVTVLETDPRSAVRAVREPYDAVVLPLTDPYRPVRSGAYSLAEQHELTQEAFGDYMRALRPGGLLVVTRWLQTPPSESLRTYALAVAAVEELGGDPEAWIVAYRGYTTMTILVKRGAWEADELASLRTFCQRWAYDLVVMPGMADAETNRYNVLERPIYREAFLELRDAEDRAAWFRAYPYQVAPPTDDRPFFGHYYRWSQLPQLWAELGHTWAPFGGAGYLVVVALLLVATAAAAVLVAMPLLARQSATRSRQAGSSRRTLLYFCGIGLGFMLVEIPLIQRYTLYLGHPAYAFSAVLAALLVFSGLGALLSRRIPLRLALGALAVVAALSPTIVAWLQITTAAWPLWARGGLAALALAPLGVLMGVPFASGLARIASRGRQGIAWAWAVNGAASVVASVVAAALALSWGARAVVLLGAACYLLAWAAAPTPTAPSLPPPQDAHP